MSTEKSMEAYVFRKECLKAYVLKRKIVCLGIQNKWMAPYFFRKKVWRLIFSESV
jgi:hypothetical protein